jgi:hypothetical protein
MQNPDGGFGGGHGQMSHCASSYAVILSLATVGGQDALELVNRKTLSVNPATEILRVTDREIGGNGLVESSRQMGGSKYVRVQRKTFGESPCASSFWP